MTQKVNGGTGAKNPVKVTEAKALAMKVAAMLNGKAKPTTKAEAKPKVDRAAERRSFIKQNGPTILKAWNALEEGKRSAMGMNRVLPSTWPHKWVDEVLMLNGLRQSGEQVVIKAVAEDKPFLKNGKAKANGKPKALEAREAKEAASVARFHATGQPKEENK